MIKKVRYDLGDGRVAHFSGKKLREALWSYKMECQSNGEKKSLQRIKEELAEATVMSESAIKHWLNDRHVPSDFEKVEAIASFLKKAPETLLVIEDEEDTAMKNMTEQVSVMTMEKADYANSKDAVKNIYAGMVGFIELFRSIVQQDVENYDAEPLRAYFVPMYTQLMLSRLDIPKDVYKELCSFAENYLQQMVVYVKFVETASDEQVFGAAGEEVLVAYEENLAPWWSNLYVTGNDASADDKLFEDVLVQQVDADRVRTDSLCFDFCEGDIIVSGAYTRLEEILADYMVK